MAVVSLYQPFFPTTPPSPYRARLIFAWLALFFSRPYCLKAQAQANINQALIGFFRLPVETINQ